MIVEREREREQNRGSKCPKCGLSTNSNGKCYYDACENYYLKGSSSDNESSRWRKGSCPKCGRSNVWIKEGGICFECLMTGVRLAIQLLIQEQGLKAAQLQWEILKTEFKRDMEEGKKRDPQVESLGNKFIETIENEVYPNRKRNRNLLILGGIIVVVGILIFYFVFWRRANNQKTDDSEE